MSLEKWKQKLERKVEQKKAQLDMDVAGYLDGDPHKAIEWSESVSGDEELADIGKLSFKGNVHAALHVTRDDEAPLDDFDGDGDAELGWLSLVLDGEIGADVGGKVAGGGAQPQVTFGLEAGAEARYAFHRGVPVTTRALEAARDLPGRLVAPYDPKRVARLAERELVEVAFGGSVALRAEAGWKYGLARRFGEVSSLEELTLDEDLGFELAATLAASFHASLSGSLRLVASPAATRPGYTRLALHKKGRDAVGAGLALTTKLGFTGVERWTDELLERALELPERLVARVEEVDTQLKGLRGKLDAVGDEGQQWLTETFGKAAKELGLVELTELRGRADDIPEALEPVLTPLVVEPVDALLAKVKELEKAGHSKIEAVIDEVAAPIDKLRKKTQGWLKAYGEMRGKIREAIVRRATAGLEAEISIGVQRTRTREALLELDFHLAEADPARLATIRKAFVAAALGNFGPALEAARLDGDNGVELHGGSLKERVETRRTLGVKLGLFGMKFIQDADSWTQLDVEEGADGSLVIAAEAGADNYREFREQIDSVSFLFDLHGSARREGGRLFFDSVDLAARFERTATFRAGQVRHLLPLHLRGAVELELLPPEEVEALVKQLRAATGPYEYALEIGLSAAGVRSLFALDRAVSKRQLRAEIWAALRRALRRLDIFVPSDGAKPCPMSLLVSQRRIDEISFDPTRRFTGVPADGRAHGFLVHNQANLVLWEYMHDVHYFIGSLLDTRDALLEQTPAAKLLRRLRHAARAVRMSTGGKKSADAKYLMLADLAGLGNARVSLTLARKDLSIQL